MIRNQDNWSNLCPDLLRPILKRLSASEFHRARTICSNWYSVSKTCVRLMYPWRIIFRNDESLLFDPIEDKIYSKPLQGIDFSSIHCLATSGNWLFIVDHHLYLYLLNVFTRERINLPSMESLRGGIGFQRKGDFCGYLIGPFGSDLVKTTDIRRNKEKAVLSMNERTRDYVVTWAYKEQYLFSYKNGDPTWRNINIHGKAKCLDMAFKDHKLSFYTYGSYINIYDFSGEFPKEVFEGNPYLNRPLLRSEKSSRIAITNSGDVLIIRSKRSLPAFYVWKMNLENRKCERVDSLGDEMLIYGHGVTLRASDNCGGGIKSDTICFVDDEFGASNENGMPLRGIRPNNCGVFDLATRSVTWADQIGFMGRPTRWFVPE